MTRVNLAVLLLAVGGVVGCGAEPESPPLRIELPAWACVAPGPCADDRREMLRGINDVIMDRLAQRVMQPAYWALRAAEQRVSSEKADVRPLDDRAGRDLVARADALLLGDRHTSLELARTRHRMILQLLQDGWAQPADLAFLMECVPTGQEAQLQRALASCPLDGGRALRVLLQDEWPWPVEPHVALLRDLARLGVRVIPAGVGYSDIVPVGEVEDERRRPDEGPPTAGPEAYARWFKQFNDANRRATSAALAWLQGGSGRRVIIEYGLLHHFFGPDAIQQTLERSGAKVLVEVGFIKEIEVALLDRFGADACGAWFDLGGGLVRSPYARIEQIAREGWN